MQPPLDDLYLPWLYSQVWSVKVTSPGRSYWKLAKQLYVTEFVWFIPNDDNRVEDGRALRQEFLDEQQIEEVDPRWMDLGCSVLEMLIGLSRRLSFEAEGEPRVWFGHLMETLCLNGCSDRGTYQTEYVSEILNRVIFRTYQSDGTGGLFPLRRAERDQREVEIWYQLSAYLLEHY